MPFGQEVNWDNPLRPSSDFYDFIWKKPLEASNLDSSNTRLKSLEFILKKQLGVMGITAKKN